MVRSCWGAAAAAVVVLFGGVGFPEPAEAQTSFDCRRASHASEVAICRDPGLASADRTLDATFRAALERSENADDLRAEQRSWLRDLRLCGEDTYCLYEAYADRIATLENSEEAGAPVVEVTEQVEPTTQDAVATVDVSAPTDIAVDVEPPINTPAEPTEVGEPTAAQVLAGPMRPDSGVPDKSRRKIANWEKALGGSLLLIPVVAVILALLATKSLAEYTSRRFSWPLIMNWWNVLYLVGYFGAWFAASLGGMMAAFGFFGAACLIVLVVNVSKTNLVTGVAMTLVQPFVVAILWVLYGITKAKAEGRRV